MISEGETFHETKHKGPRPNKLDVSVLRARNLIAKDERHNYIGHNCIGP